MKFYDNAIRPSIKITKIYPSSFRSLHIITPKYFASLTYARLFTFIYISGRFRLNPRGLKTIHNDLIAYVFV